MEELVPAILSELSVSSSATEEAIVFSCDMAVSPPLGANSVSYNYSWFRQGDPFPLSVDKNFPVTSFITDYYNLEHPYQLSCVVTVSSGGIQTLYDSDIGSDDIAPTLSLVETPDFQTSEGVSGTILTCSAVAEEITFELHEMSTNSHLSLFELILWFISKKVSSKGVFTSGFCKILQLYDFRDR